MHLQQQRQQHMWDSSQTESGEQHSPCCTESEPAQRGGSNGQRCSHKRWSKHAWRSRTGDSVPQRIRYYMSLTAGDTVYSTRFAVA